MTVATPTAIAKSGISEEEEGGRCPVRWQCASLYFSMLTTAAWLRRTIHLRFCLQPQFEMK